MITLGLEFLPIHHIPENQLCLWLRSDETIGIKSFLTKGFFSYVEETSAKKESNNNKAKQIILPFYISLASYIMPIMLGQTLARDWLLTTEFIMSWD